LKHGIDRGNRPTGAIFGGNPGTQFCSLASQLRILNGSGDAFRQAKGAEPVPGQGSGAGANLV
jgi:hypothetical protein